MVAMPMWFALPPEVHSTLLSTGAGPGPLLAAAEAWHALAVQYTDIATELASVLAAVQASAWEGSTADQFVAAHQPFLYWLNQAAAVAMAAAAAHETAAAGYASALASMPTLAELATNHAVHGALVATNFFGINAIPIALNEADYLRMWIQAAITMSVYQAVAQDSVAATPTTSRAPAIVTAEAAPAASSFPDPVKIILQALQDFLTFLRNLAAETLSGPLGQFVVQALDWFISFVSGPVFKFMAYLFLDPMIYFGPFTPALSPFGLPAGLIGLAGIAGFDALPQEAVPVVAGVHSDGSGQHLWPAATGATLAGVSSAAAAAPAPAPTTSPAPASHSALGWSAAQGFYAVGGPDGEGFTPSARTKSLVAAAADAAAPAAKVPAEAALASAKKVARGRGRLRQHRYEFLEVDTPMTIPAAPTAEPISAGDRGSGPLGFSDTIPKSTAAQAKGFTRLSRGKFDDAPAEPMLPNTWSG
ncbi:putative PPE family protein PPE37 [Mycobacterium simulans]|uniref:PPE family protein n=1 Tax=Mycobacterium simulans TaxID=627089 RepID=UPI00198A8512|nr:PPE family protein [Mycobacterium simulans]SON61975.1 putative PPE family protein PPE37 [Mycobacterium simulans]